MNTADPDDEHSADCAVCGLSIDDHETRNAEHPGIHEDCKIENYRSPVQQIKDSYINGQLKQAWEWIGQMSLEGFISEALDESEISGSMLLEILKHYVRRS